MIPVSTFIQLLGCTVLALVAWAWLAHKALRMHLAIREQKWRIDELEKDRDLDSVAHVKHVARYNELCERMSRNEELARRRSRRIRLRARSVEVARRMDNRLAHNETVNDALDLDFRGEQ